MRVRVKWQNVNDEVHRCTNHACAARSSSDRRCLTFCMSMRHSLCTPRSVLLPMCVRVAFTTRCNPNAPFSLRYITQQVKQPTVESKYL